MEEHVWRAPVDSSGTPGDFLRRLREQLRLTQQETAALAGVDRSLIAKIEAERDVRIGTLSRLVEALGGRLILTVRSPRPLKDMAEDHVPGREAEATDRQHRRAERAIARSRTDSPS